MEGLLLEMVYNIGKVWGAPMWRNSTKEPYHVVDFVSTCQNHDTTLRKNACVHQCTQVNKNIYI